MFIVAAVCAWFLRSWKVIQDQQGIAAKQRREDPDTQVESHHELKVMSGRWAIQLVKGLVIWAKV